MAGSLARRFGAPPESERTYVEVDVERVMLPAGRSRETPIRVRWHDGRSWEIEGVISTMELGSRRLGDVVERLCVKIAGRPRVIWRERDRWFVVAKRPRRASGRDNVD